MRRYNTLTPDDIAKYKQRSEMAINGIDKLLQELPSVLECNTIEGKYTKIASYLGLSEEGTSRYNYFVPLNKDIVFLLRLSNHNNTNEILYNKFEQMGRPDVRYIVCFNGKQHILPTCNLWLESQHNVIPYTVDALDTYEDIREFLMALKKLFTKGSAKFPKLPCAPKDNPKISTTNINNSFNNSTNENKEYKTNKQVIRLTESELHNIIKESVKQVLKKSFNRSLC
ncbi:MAG: hypothetical protein J6R17_09960 [Bacteroidales bacterium]|nr:hypothetical protein [Bacteroidales bacterium]